MEVIFGILILGLLAFVFVVKIAAAYYSLIESNIRKLQRKSQERKRDRQIRDAEQAIRKATDDPEITQLMMWLREDLTPKVDERALEKLRAICVKPNLVLVAFRTALDCSDEAMRYVGIAGLGYLKHEHGIAPLLKYYATTDNFRDEASTRLYPFGRRNKEGRVS